MPPSWEWILRHISAADVPIWTKFSSLMQNNMQITAKWARLKPEVEFQHGGRLYFENGNSYISAANWDISTKFGLLIDCDLLEAVTSIDTRPEVVSRRRGRHLENGYYVIFLQWVLRFGRNSVAWCRIMCRFRANGQNRNRKLIYNMADVCFSKTGANNWDMSTKFGLLIDFDLLKTVTSTNTKPELLFSGRGRYLEKWIWRHISAYFGVEQLYR